MPTDTTISPYPSNSVRELLYITFPLMLSTLSGFLMILVDRVVLSYYSLDAMQSAAGAGSVQGIFIYPIIVFVLTAEAFVGQYNGSKQFREMGPTVWQMIWLSLASAIIFIPLARWGTPWLLAKDFQKEGAPYLSTILYMGFLQPLVSALSAFYIGRGKTRVITVVTLLGNCVNAFLALLLVFCFGPVPALGTRGAALATVLSWLLQAITLSCLFLSKPNREGFATGCWYFSFKKFQACARIGSATAAFHILEMLGWGLFLQVIAPYGEAYVAVWLMGQNFWYLFGFFFKSLSQGLTVLVSNCIGSNRLHQLPALLRSTWIIETAFAVFLLLVLFTSGSSIIELFFRQPQCAASIVSLLNALIPLYALSLLVDSITWVFYGYLMAGGDTWFACGTSLMNALFFLPLGYLSARFQFHPACLPLSLTGYLMSLSLIYWIRYKSGNWVRLRLGH